MKRMKNFNKVRLWMLVFQRILQEIRWDRVGLKRLNKISGLGHIHKMNGLYFIMSGY